MSTQQHHIDSIKVQLRLSSEELALEWQDRFREMLKQEVLPALDTLFDRYSDPGISLQIDRLRIDLGKLPAGASAKTVARQLLEALEEQLRHFNREQKGVTKTPVALRRLEVLRHFFRFGTLPAGRKWKAGLAAEVEAVTKNEPEAWWNMIKELVENHPMAIRRIVHQLPLTVTVRWLTDHLPSAWDKQFRALFPALAAGEQRMLLLELFLRLLSGEPFAERQLIEALSDWFRTLSERRRRELRLKELFPSRILEQMAERDLESDSSAAEPEAPLHLNGEPLLVPNAGVVLLHPFLPTLFAAVGLTNQNGSFKGEQQQFQAVYLLHFLATGTSEAAEYELPFQKVLCGLAAESFVPVDMPLTEAMTAEADTLLKAVVGHWKALGSTSPDGLREGFLQRTGQLTRSDGADHLRMESKTLDILLGKLPWAISLVQLPWMRNSMQVDWEQ